MRDLYADPHPVYSARMWADLTGKPAPTEPDPTGPATTLHAGSAEAARRVFSAQEWHLQGAMRDLRTAGPYALLAHAAIWDAAVRLVNAEPSVPLFPRGEGGPDA